MDLQPRVMIVCASSECRRVLGEVLHSWDLAVVSADTVGEAKGILRQAAVLVVFSEDVLSDGSYRDLLELAAQKRPPVRLVVLLRDHNQYAETLSLGAYDALPVPLERADVQWMVIHALRGRDESFPAGMLRQLRKRSPAAFSSSRPQKD